MKIEAFFDSATSTVSYLVMDESSRTAAVIDPVLDFDPSAGRLTTVSADRMLAALADHKAKLEWVLDTHAHADHLSAGDYIRSRTGAKYGIGARIGEVSKTFVPMFNAKDVKAPEDVFDALFEDDAIFSIGNVGVRVMHTPGHTPADLTYLIKDAAFCGDTLFMPDFGTARADFPGGDARTLYRSIMKLFSLPSETRVFVGHDYLPKGRTEFKWETTVAEQQRDNIHVHDGVSEDQFVTMREERDKTLPAPRLILPSLQVNIRGGALPPMEDDGHTYMKLPVNRL